jgi:hypothetical protein
MGRLFIDLAGKRFERIIVVQKTNMKVGTHIVWRCICDCGKEILISSDCLRSGRTKSCGCLGISIRREIATKHGCSTRYKKTREYSTWSSMIQRCTNQKHKSYKNYGGRGIKICDEWRNSFSNFLAYLKSNNMFPRPIGFSIDRINNDGNYESGNIKWSTPTEQNNIRILT